MTPRPVIRRAIDNIARRPVLAELTVRQVAAFYFLRDEPPERCTVGAIASHLNASRSSIKRAVNRLYAIGVAVGRTDPDDKRAILVSLTPGGREMAMQMLPPAQTTNPEGSSWRRPAKSSSSSTGTSPSM